MTLETQGADRGVTPDGMQRLMRFIAAVRPHQPIDPDVIAAWTHKLNEHGINDRDALTAANRLADNDDGRDIPVGAVVHAARNIRNRRYLDERPTTPELPRGESRWDRLSDDERAPYIDQALAAWHGFATRRDSPLVVGMARHLANGGSLTPPDPTPAGRCRCGGRLMLDDRATMTAKCDRCRCDFILEAA